METKHKEKRVYVNARKKIWELLLHTKTRDKVYFNIMRENQKVKAKYI